VLAGGEVFVGVGSDHTDRALERLSIPAAKQACPKVAGTAVWRLDEVEDHWDRLELRAWVGHAARHAGFDVAGRTTRGTEERPWPEELRDQNDAGSRPVEMPPDGSALYQEGTVASLLAPRDLIAAVQAQAAVTLDQAVIFGGTLPLRGGRFIPSAEFIAELYDPIHDRRLRCAYRVRLLSWLAD
jgi:hypothetical protein